MIVPSPDTFGGARRALNETLLDTLPQKVAIAGAAVLALGLLFLVLRK